MDTLANPARQVGAAAAPATRTPRRRLTVTLKPLLPALLWASLATLLSASPARAGDDEAPAQNFAALEAAGVRIGEIRVRAEDIFDIADPREDKWLFRLANKLHIQTRPEVIERAQLTKFMRQVGVSTWDELYQFSISDVEKFTEEVLRFLDIKFDPPYEKLLDLSNGVEFPNWFGTRTSMSACGPNCE